MKATYVDREWESRKGERKKGHQYLLEAQVILTMLPGDRSRDPEVEFSTSLPFPKSKKCERVCVVRGVVEPLPPTYTSHPLLLLYIRMPYSVSHNNHADLPLSLHSERNKRYTERKHSLRSIDSRPSIKLLLCQCADFVAGGGYIKTREAKGGHRYISDASNILPLGFDQKFLGNPRRQEKRRIITEPLCLPYFIATAGSLDPGDIHKTTSEPLQ